MSDYKLDVKITAQRDVSIGEFVGRDKIVNNIQNIIERALTAAEELDKDRDLEARVLAEGVRSYVERLHATAREGEGKKSSPYKGLQEYRLSDAQFFFGRAQAIEDLLGLLERGPLTVLHAESGAGKSSLLQAGLAAFIIATGHLPLYLRPYNVEPSLVIKRALLTDLSQTPLLATAPLREFLRQVASVLGPQIRLHIFIDQFEEFFTTLEAPARDEFVRELAECLDDPGLNVRWVLSMRAEFFGNLANFRPRIRNPFENDYRLNRLTRDEAKEVAGAPAARRGVRYDPGLIDQILDDLGAGGGAVHPPEIQLVCSALYDELPPGGSVITQAMYESAGKAEGILREHLERVLSRDLPPAQRPVAQQLLEALITSDNRRVQRTRQELAAELAPRGVTPETLDAVLTQLVDSRLLRVQEKTVEKESPAYEAAPGISPQQLVHLAYELTHDYLLGKIALDPAVQARKAAQELLDYEVKAYLRHGTLLSNDKLSIIEARRPELRLSPDAQSLILKSEKALRRQRQFVFGGIGFVLVLVIVGALSVLSAVGARQQQAIAVQTQRAAVTEAHSAATQMIEARSLQEVSEARAREAATQAGAADALRATSEAAALLAGDSEATAVSAQATAVSREAAANAVVRSLFEREGLVPVGGRPSAFAFDGTRLWVVNRNDDSIQSIDPATGQAGLPITVGDEPRDITFDGTRLWVVHWEESSVRAVDPATGAVSEPIAVAANPIALAYTGEQLWVASYTSNTVQAIHPGSGALMGEPIEIAGGPWALTFDGARLWVASYDGSFVQPVDVAAGTPGQRTFVDTNPIALSYAGGKVWVASFTENTVQSIDPETGRVLNKITVGTNPFAFVFDQSRLWVTNRGSNTVQAINPASAVPGAAIRVGNSPSALAFVNKRLWIASRDNNVVQMLDPVVGDLSAPIRVGESPDALAVVNGELWIASRADNLVEAINLSTGARRDRPSGSEPRALLVEGGRLWIANAGDDSLNVIHLDTNRISTILVDAGPAALAYDGSRVWVANSQANTVQAINPETRQVEVTIAVGRQPIALVFDDQRIWVACAGDNTVQAIVPTTGRLLGAPIEVGNTPSALAYDGRLVWVANSGDDSIQSIDPAARTAGGVIPVGNNPVALAFDQTQLWVANHWSNTVQAIDTVTGTAGAPISVELGPVALAFDGSRLWIASLDRNTVQSLTLHP